MATAQRQEIDLGITRFEYGDADRPQRAVLEIDTRKHYSGGLISCATVYWVGQHSRQNCIALGGNGEDFRNRLKLSANTVKATQRNIDRQHAEVFTPDVMVRLHDAAKAHYAAAVSAGIDGFKNTYPKPEVTA